MLPIGTQIAYSTLPSTLSDLLFYGVETKTNVTSLWKQRV